jgi:3-keto-disaccharide hydrolase
VKKLLVLTMALLVPVAWAQHATMNPWRSLLDDGGSAWRGWKSADLPAGWQIDGDTISKGREVEDIVTRETFGNFELELEWKIGDASNSGVFYRGTDEFNQIYWSAPEYQLLDNVNAADNKQANHLAGSVYDLYAVPADAAKPAGEWNQTRIVAKGPHVEHWLNGRKVAQYDVGSKDWEAALAASKFKPYANFAKAPKGILGIQGNHPGSLALRNIRIRELQ